MKEKEQKSEHYEQEYIHEYIYESIDQLIDEDGKTLKAITKLAFDWFIAEGAPVKEFNIFKFKK